jgi:hypothetical protein
MEMKVLINIVKSILNNLLFYFNIMNIVKNLFYFDLNIISIIRIFLRLFFKKGIRICV